MKNTILASLVMFASITASAANIPAKVQKVAAEIKAKEVRTLVTEVENTDGNPCMPEGKSYIVELQTKNAYWNGLEMKVEYKWETAKTVGVDVDGRSSEVCAE